MKDALRSTQIKSIELHTTHDLLFELSKRFNGFIFAGHYSSRVRGEYPDQVWWDTDLPTLEEISNLGGQMFDLAASEMADPEDQE